MKLERKTIVKDILRRVKPGETEQPRSEAERLVADIREVCRQIDNTHALFALESDEDLLDAAIYQLEALNARYRFLLKRARETRAEATALPITGEERERWI